MAPLTRSRAGPGNVPNELNALYYAQRATAGLIISEATQISPEGQGYISTPGIHSAEQIEGWKCVTQAVYVAGGHIVLQLWHVGRISHPSFQPGGAAPVAPSAIRPNGQAFTEKGFEPIPTPRALEMAEIPAIVEQYAQAARNALAAGFDGVEVHAANGYLIDQFLRDQTNKRTDRYGGNIENRSRFLMEVVKAVSAAVGAERTGVRISPQNTQNDIADSDPQILFNYVAEQLSGKGLAYLHIIEGDTSGLPVPPFDYKNLKRLFGGLVIANNGFDKPRANKAIANGRADLIAFGKPFIANPDFVIRLFLDAPLMPLNRETLYGGSEQGHGLSNTARGCPTCLLSRRGKGLGMISMRYAKGFRYWHAADPPRWALPDTNRSRLVRDSGYTRLTAGARRKQAFRVLSTRASCKRQRV
jgi:N-ethylmaleimide reductase